MRPHPRSKKRTMRNRNYSTRRELRRYMPRSKYVDWRRHKYNPFQPAYGSAVPEKLRGVAYMMGYAMTIRNMSFVSEVASTHRPVSTKTLLPLFDVAVLGEMPIRVWVTPAADQPKEPVNYRYYPDNKEIPQSLNEAEFAEAMKYEVTGLNASPLLPEYPPNDYSVGFLRNGPDYSRFAADWAEAFAKWGEAVRHFPLADSASRAAYVANSIGQSNNVPAFDKWDDIFKQPITLLECDRSDHMEPGLDLDRWLNKLNEMPKVWAEVMDRYYVDPKKELYGPVNLVCPGLEQKYPRQLAAELVYVQDTGEILYPTLITSKHPKAPFIRIIDDNGIDLASLYAIESFDILTGHAVFYHLNPTPDLSSLNGRTFPNAKAYYRP